MAPVNVAFHRLPDSPRRGRAAAVWARVGSANRGPAPTAIRPWKYGCKPGFHVPQRIVDCRLCAGGGREFPGEFRHSGIAVDAALRGGGDLEATLGKGVPHGPAVKIVPVLLSIALVLSRMEEGRVRCGGPDAFGKAAVVGVVGESRAAADAGKNLRRVLLRNVGLGGYGFVLSGYSV